MLANWGQGDLEEEGMAFVSALMEAYGTNACSHLTPCSLNCRWSSSLPPLCGPPGNCADSRMNWTTSSRPWCLLQACFPVKPRASRPFAEFAPTHRFPQRTPTSMANCRPRRFYSAFGSQTKAKNSSVDCKLAEQALPWVIPLTMLPAFWTASLHSSLHECPLLKPNLGQRF